MPSGIYSLRQYSQATLSGGIVNVKPSEVEALVVAGGGGTNSYGGGGGGGVIYTNTNITPGTSYTVTVGAGGTTVPGTGSNSEFGPLIAYGGGKSVLGSSGETNRGGSGGGNYEGFPGGMNVGHQGFLGAGSAFLGSTYAAGGGGGAAMSSTNTLGSPTTGGHGLCTYITGSVTCYGGGGSGGQAYQGDVILKGAAGGGGENSNSTNSYTPQNGAVNTGGGGGGSSYASGSGGSASGGSGIVILSYPDIYDAAASTTGSPTITTSGAGSIQMQWNGGSGSSSVPSYLRYTGTSAFAIGTTGTYEFWIYVDSFIAGVSSRVISQGTTNGIDISYNDAGTLTFSVGGVGSATVASAITSGSWIHIACVVNTSNLTIYKNGVLQTPSGTTSGYSVTATDTLSISGYAPIIGQYGIHGKLADVRIVKGVAVYTGAFTPSEEPLQATQPAGTNISAITGTQTSLLLNGYSGAYLMDYSTNGYQPATPATTSANAPTWSYLSPIPTGRGFKNRVYKWTSSGSITF